MAINSIAVAKVVFFFEMGKYFGKKVRKIFIL